MKRSSNKVGAFEAKTHLAELLRQTEHGRSFVIHRRGKPVARLVPPIPEEDKPRDLTSLSEAFRSIRAGIRGSLKIRELIETGRRR
ncbi:MAG: type II toxin-antitoxin system prevent-host-death family antitoxin [Nitrospiraceae bacterium]